MIARPVAVLIACASLAACQSQDLGETRAPLIGGDIHEGDEAVAAITTSGGNPFCTGTLVSPSVVMTAAHCVDMASADPDFRVFFGDDTQGEGRTVGVSRAETHPDWTGSLADEHDIGLMLLDVAQDPLLPVPLNGSPITDHVGDQVRRIGFGIHDRDTGEVDGKKRAGTTVIHQVSPGGDFFYAGDDELSTCSGDSGGPALLTVEDVEYVAGVHSFGFDSGDTRCVPPYNGDTRVDLYGASFVVPWIDDNDPRCGADGTCAPIGCSDDPDCQPCGADGTCTSDCPLPDPDCPTSEIGEICQADTQCTTGLCVYWKGDPSTHFCSRECDPAASDCPESMTCERVSGLGDVCYYEEAPPGVLGSDCEQATDCGSYICEMGRCVTPCDLSQGMGCPGDFECSSLDDGASYYCHAIEGEGGGCQTGGDTGTGGIWLLLVIGLIADRLSRGWSRCPRRP